MVGGRPALELHSSDEPGELSQQQCRDDSIGNIVVHCLPLLRDHLPGTKPGESRLKVYWNHVAQLARQKRDGHSVCVAGRRLGRRVNVGMSIDPDDTDVRVDTSLTGHRAYSHAVITAQHQTLTAFPYCILHRSSYLQ